MLLLEDADRARRSADAHERVATRQPECTNRLPAGLSLLYRRRERQIELRGNKDDAERGHPWSRAAWFTPATMRVPSCSTASARSRCSGDAATRSRSRPVTFCWSIELRSASWMVGQGEVMQRIPLSLTR